MNIKRDQNNFTWLVLLIGTAISAFSGLLVNVLPYSLIKNLFNLLAPDGNLESLTLDAFIRLGDILGILGGFAFVIFLTLIFRKSLSQIWIAQGFRKPKIFLQSFRDDAASFWQSSKRFFPRSSETILLFSIVIAGAVVRGIFLDRPMLHDESYTYMQFASKGIIKILSDYHLPNNHVFHNLLVYFSESIFGNFEPWVVRLPAFIAGVIIIPAVYIVGKMVFNNLAGLLAAALIAFNFHSINYSTQARGYSMLALISVGLWIFSIRLTRERNIFVWFLFATLAALGFFTLPTMLYPYAAIMAWLGISRLLGDKNPEYPSKRFWKDFSSSIIVTGFLTILSYSLILARPSVNRLINNPLISKMRDPNYREFFENLLTRWGKVWASWHEGTLPYLAITGAILFLIALVYRKRYSKLKVPFPLFGLLIILGIMMVQRTVGWQRIWGFALPFYLVYLGGGISILTDLIKTRFGRSWKLIFPTLIVGIFAFSSISLVSGSSITWQEWRGAKGEVERASEYLENLIVDDSQIFVISPDAPAFWYYAKKMYFPPQIFDTTIPDVTNIYIVIDTRSSQSIESVVNAQTATFSNLKLNMAELIYSSRRIEIYYFSNLEAMFSPTSFSQLNCVV